MGFDDQWSRMNVIGRGFFTVISLDVGSIPEKKSNRNDAIAWEQHVDSGRRCGTDCCTRLGARLGDRIALYEQDKKIARASRNSRADAYRDSMGW
jgi:hypothetical protein